MSHTNVVSRAPQLEATSLSFSARFFNNELEQDWQRAGNGICRPAYTERESHATLALAAAAAEKGAEIFSDLAGNHYFVYRGSDPYASAVFMGSHLDAVEHGGRYDGTAGCVGAVQAIHTLLEKHIALPQDTVVVVWRGEESDYFGQFALGSHMAFGHIGPEVLQRRDKVSDEAIATRMKQPGWTQIYGDNVKPLIEKLEAREPLAPIENIRFLAEMHIEQGHVLRDAGNKLGFITDIRGNVRYPEITFTGEAGHTGTVPQTERRNAAMAVSHFNVMLDEGLQSLSHGEEDLVWGPTNLGVKRHARTTIPAHATTMWDIRSADKALLQFAKEEFASIAHRAAHAEGCTVSWDETQIVEQAPVQLDPSLIPILEAWAKAEGIAAQRIISGAGHDMAMAQQAGVAAVGLFLEHEGRSHYPDELMADTPNDDPFALDGSYAAGVRALMELALQPPEKRGSCRETVVENLIRRGAKNITAQCRP
jgi:N-carbamoyl-L-amino-acid hydrolase